MKRGSRPSSATVEQARVSVVIPCYQQGHFLADAIRSALTQSRSPLEVIVVNDGSTDETEDVARSFPEVTLITQVNAGLPAARNRGFHESTGDFLVFLDADDRLLTNAIDVGVRFLADHPDHAFTWGFNRPIDRDGAVIGGISNPLTGPATFVRLLERNIVGPPVGVMFRRLPLEEERGFAPGVNAVEDYDMYVRLAKTRPFGSHGQLVAEYRYHEAKMSDDFDRMYDSLTALANRLDHLVGDDPVLRAAVARGRRNAHKQFRVEPRIEGLGDDVREGRWLKAATSAAELGIRYPRVFLPRLWGSLRRRIGLSSR